MRRRGIMAAVCLLLLASPLATSVAPNPAYGLQRTLTVGSLELQRCEDHPRIWSGSFPAPLDRDDPASPKLDIAFAWQPAEEESTGALVVQEGGPGYPTIGSLSLWQTMFGPRCVVCPAFLARIGPIGDPIPAPDWATEPPQSPVATPRNQTVRETGVTG